MKHLAIIFGFVLLAGCTVTVPDYVSGTGEGSSPWLDMYGDSTKDMSVYISYSNGTLTASISGYANPDSLNFLQDIDVAIAEFSSQSTELNFCFGPFPGTDKVCHTVDDYAPLAISINTEGDTMQCDQVSFAGTRTYSVQEEKLPEELTLQYSVKTIYGTKTGSYPFRKIEKEETNAVRIH